MNPRAPKPHPIPTALRKLWREARGLVAWLVTAIDRPALSTTGISREQGAKVSIWLMNIEASVRRLILSAALTFTLPTPRTIACAHTPAPRKHALTRRPGFCVFRLAGASETPAIPTQLQRTTTPTARKPFSHIAFPSDPLLNLGASQRGHAHATPPPITRHARHPLDRWVRPARQDPDWRSHEDENAMFADREHDEDTPKRKRAKREPRPKSEPRDPNELPYSLHDWRRCHDEWQRHVPAPDLAARLDALTRITQDPRAAITSAARRLARSRLTTTTLARRATPRTNVPRRAAHLYTDHRRIDLPDRCHAQIARADTS
ncbi:MAG TPA: hypothetical protein PLN33_16480 [Hyphomonadaceae bacterium]|nr:hypothetical protein [Hyphomonadaceae bacterium]HPN06152.1 hypothetical protein [Hyphomonadaceae bacterium]